MRSVVLTALFVTVFLWQASFAQPTWQKTFGTIYTDRAEEMIQTSDGNYILVGRINLGGVNGATAYIIKADSQGDTIWTLSYQLVDSGNGTAGYSVCESPTGGYLVGGG